MMTINMYNVDWNKNHKITSVTFYYLRNILINE